MSETPIKEIRYGQKSDYVKAAIWENTTEKGQVYHSVNVARHYWHNDAWHETQTLYAHHLPLAQLANSKAFEFIHEKQEELNKQPKEEEVEKTAPAKKRGRRKTHAEKVEDEKKSTPKTK